MNVSDGGISKEIEALRQTLRLLRSENGCSWDREQSMDDIISYLIDECYELLRAEKTGDREGIEEELGDVMLMVLFVHELLLEERETPLSEIVASVHRKIINRHPHVFGDAPALNREESVLRWEQIKRTEKRSRTLNGIMASVSPDLPPLRKALAIQKKAALIGFDWPDHHGALEKLGEEIVELEQAVSGGDRSKVKGEMGDLIFTAVNAARMLHVDPENALEITSNKFLDRFHTMEKLAERRGTPLEDMTLDEMESLWQESKDT